MYKPSDIVGTFGENGSNINLSNLIAIRRKSAFEMLCLLQTQVNEPSLYIYNKKRLFKHLNYTLRFVVENEFKISDHIL